MGLPSGKGGKYGEKDDNLHPFGAREAHTGKAKHGVLGETQYLVLEKNVPGMHFADSGKSIASST